MDLAAGTGKLSRELGARGARVLAVEHTQRFEADPIAMRFGSVSFIASLPDAERAEVLKRLRALTAAGPADVRYRTELFTCRRVWCCPGGHHPNGGQKHTVGAANSPKGGR